ncbi:MAG: CAP domain-containing protein [Anaerolineales bacterium]
MSLTKAGSRGRERSKLVEKGHRRPVSRLRVVFFSALVLMLAIASAGCTRSLVPVDALQENNPAVDNPSSAQSPAEDSGQIAEDNAEQGRPAVTSPEKLATAQAGQQSPTPGPGTPIADGSATPTEGEEDPQATQPAEIPEDGTPTPAPTKPGYATPTPDGSATTPANPTPPSGAPTPTSTPIPPPPPPPAPPDATDTPIPPDPTATAIPPTATPTPGESCAATGNAGFESTLIGLINQERASRGIAPLSANSRLTSAARSHSLDMACNDFFSHTGSDGSSPFGRMAAYGYSYSAAGENIYGGSGSFNSPYSAFNSWMASPGHRTIMLDPTYIHVGIGYKYNAASTYGGYFTADFGKP